MFYVRFVAKMYFDHGVGYREGAEKKNGRKFLGLSQIRKFWKTQTKREHVM